MKLLSILLLLSLAAGQIGGISLLPGVVIYAHDIILAALCIESFVQYAATGKFNKPKLMKPVLLVCGAALLSFLTNSGKYSLNELEAGSLYLVRWVFYSLIYVIVLQRYTQKILWQVGLFATGTGVAVLGLIQFALYPDLRNLAYLGWDPHFYRLFSTFLDPNFAGIFLVLTILFGLYLWQQNKLRMLLAVGEVLSFIALLLTYSRSSYLALAAGFVVYGILKKQWIIIMALVVFAVAAVIVPRSWGDNLSLLRTDSSLARIGNWKESIVLIAQAPVFGYGFNMLRYVRIVPPGPFFSKAAAGFDSSVLFVVATTGIVGLLAFTNLVFTVIRGVTGALRPVYLASCAAIFLHSIFVNSAFYPWILLWMWILTALAERISDDTSPSS